MKLTQKDKEAKYKLTENNEKGPVSRQHSILL